jgi:hypothetical protein
VRELQKRAILKADDNVRELPLRLVSVVLEAIDRLDGAGEVSCEIAELAPR